MQEFWHTVPDKVRMLGEFQDMLLWDESNIFFKIKSWNTTDVVFFSRYKVVNYNMTSIFYRFRMTVYSYLVSKKVDSVWSCSFLS